ncbi:hypothetical protein ED28_12010 [[Pantoea] beijingensis]|uniref:DUF2509 family protein n=1 Tax=[Pantoea] beijingensis TaxID=1324864 RepID=A0A443IC46_9GAMM|nr:MULTISPECIES: DUF2509 family protein [Erwiniaceae]RWR01742.1 hypothetical protein ED28_12010 [[Pantoea] beijingensis]
MKQQQGSSALVMVAVILLLGSALLHSTRQQLAASFSLVADEREYITRFYLAQAALAWGMQQHWQKNSQGWQCKSDERYKWRACLQGSDKNRWLLRGDSFSASDRSLALWQWVMPGTTNTLQPLAHGWIDFCPLTEEAKCVPEMG